MRTIILLILTFVLAQVSIAQPELINKYLNLIESENPSAEVLWSTALMYHSLSHQDKDYLLENLYDEDLSYALKNYSSSQSMLKIGEKFNSEHLLLTYLLNEESSKTRLEVFERFYTNTSSEKRLKSLNKNVVNESTLGDEFYSSNPDPFVLFLLGNYNRTVNVIDRRFYEFIISQKNEILYPQDASLLNELFLASYFNALYSLNNFEKITDIYDQLLNLKFYPISYDKRNLFWSLDYVMYSLGYLDRSLEIQREFSLPLSEYLGDAGGVHAIHSSHGGYLYMLGKYREAREVFESTLRRSDNLSDQNLTRLYNNLSLVYFMTGESSKYVETQLKALEHAKSYENYDHQISIFRNLHIFYRKNQNYQLANLYIDRAANLAEEIDNREDLISILISKSVFESSYMDDNEKADLYLKKAEELVSDDVSNRYVIRILSERAELLKAQSRYAESLYNLKTISDLALSQNNTSYYLESLVKISELNFQLGNYNESINLLKTFRTHDISIVDFSVLTLSRMLQAKLHHINGEFTKAEELFSETTNMVLERARYSADHETGYWTVETEYLQLFEAHADFLIERSMYEEAVQLLDRVKTINDTSLLQNPLITSTQLTEEQLSRDRKITNEMETLRRRLFTASGNDRLQLNSQLERLQAQKKELFQHQRVSPEEQREFPLWSIRRTLASDQILIHITSINENYYLSKITRNNTEIQKITIDEERRDIIESAIQGMISGRTDLRKLYQIGQLFHLHDISDNFSSAILMPDGFLHQLPIDVIPINEPATSNSYGATTFLIEKVDVRTLNRLSDIRKQHQNRKFDYDFTGFGVADFQNAATQRTLMPLPKAPGEVTTVSNNLNRFTNKTTFLESDATPRKFKEIAGKSRILHMATHSEISESDPLFSRLHLMPEIDSENSDNQIFAYELFELDLQNELIMLNSCESGGDRAIQGSGIMGLSRALHYAGAQSLVLNAWSVNDQFAAEFAEVFYQYINDGESKSRALQLTKIDFLRYKNANPHFWGPYILNGNNQPLIQKKNANLGNWIIALIFIAGFIAVSRSRQPAAA